MKKVIDYKVRIFPANFYIDLFYDNGDCDWFSISTDGVEVEDKTDAFNYSIADIDYIESNGVVFKSDYKERLQFDLEDLRSWEIV